MDNACDGSDFDFGSESISHYCPSYQNKTKENVTVHECDDAWVWTMPQFVENGTGE